MRERRLLTIAALGGGVGAVCGQRFFRHKVQKEPVRSDLRMLLTMQTVVLIALLVTLSFGGS